jgi:competence protein ComEA
VSSGSIRDWLATLERRELIGLLLIGIVVVAGAGFWYVRSLPSPVHVEASLRRGSPDGGEAPAPSASPSLGIVVVHVAGWVRRPGVYRLAEGDRVVDAVRVAGGARKGADLTSVNLAALLTDGEQILIVKLGKPPPGGGSGTSVGGSTAGSSGGGSLVNINTATLDELDGLPGIGDVLGQRIIDYREQHGPFETVDDLLNVSGIGDKTMADLRPLITV